MPAGLESGLLTLRQDLRNAFRDLIDGDRFTAQALDTIEPTYRAMWETCDRLETELRGRRTAHLRMEAARSRLVSASKLPPDVSDHVLLEAILDRFRHMERAAGVPTSTLGGAT